MGKIKVVVTGATGFIGRRVVKLLANKYEGDEVLCLVRNKKSTPEKSGILIIKKCGFKMKIVDLVKNKGLKNFPKNPRIIIHLAANTDTSDPDHSVNDTGTVNLIKAFSPLDPKTHLIYTSTTALMSGRRNCDNPFNENSKPAPTNEYGRTKLKAEKILMDESKKQNFKLTLFRLPTVYGKGMRKDSFFDFVKKLILKNSIFVRLNWPGKTSFVHVEDVAKAIVATIKKPPRPSKVQILILQTESFTLDQISKMLHRKLRLKYKPIKLPNFFWKIVASFRLFFYNLEILLTPKFYNYIWRASLIIDDVIYSKSQKINQILPSGKLKRLKNCISEVV